MRHSIWLPVLVPVLACLPTITAAQWHNNGVQVTTGAGNESPNAMLSDNAGGAIISWYLDPYSDPYTNHLRAQRLNGGGMLQWQSDGVIMLPANGGYGFVANSNGTDGVFTVWDDDGLRMQWFDHSGLSQWGQAGVFLSNVYNYALTRVVTDQAGGAIVVWQDWRPGHENELYGQRVNASGTPLWPGEGIPLVVLPGGLSWRVQQAWHSIASDGAGGVVVAWQDFRSHTTSDIYAQRLGPSGQRLWGDEAVLLCTPAGEQREPVLASDGAGGAFVAWNDLRNSQNYDVYAQHVDTAGAIQWGTDGLPVRAQSSEEEAPKVVSDGATGVFINWRDHRAGNNFDQYIQHYDAAGVEQWTPGGAKVITMIGGHAILSIIPNAEGGALVGFMTGFNVRAQRMSPSGAREWGDSGIVIANGSGFGAVPDGAGGMIVAWNNGDIFAQRVTADGQVATAVNAPTPGATLRVGEIFPNPFSGSTTLDIELAKPAVVRVDVFDVAGRRVRQMALPESITSQRMSFDGRDDAGKLLASGVYFCRVQARGESITRKIVITR